MWDTRHKLDQRRHESIAWTALTQVQIDILIRVNTVSSDETSINNRRSCIRLLMIHGAPLCYCQLEVSLPCQVLQLRVYRASEVLDLKLLLTHGSDIKIQVQTTSICLVLSYCLYERLDFNEVELISTTTLPYSLGLTRFNQYSGRTQVYVVEHHTFTQICW